MGLERPSGPTRDLSPGDRERILNFHNLRPGELFARRYRIVETIGHGGAGEVYRVRDEVAGQEVALKVLFPGSGSITLERLRRELRLVRDLRHPGILRIYDIGAADGLLYLVSELLEGESLKERLVREEKLKVSEARRILIAVLEALRAAHDAGVVHRDVKPANIFLARGYENLAGDRVVLLDFGLAREASSEGLTTVGRFVGTPEYSAPEQIRGDADLGPAADLYSCGVLAWQMISGKAPYRGNSDVSILGAHLKGALPPLRKELPGAPVVMRSVIVRLLEKEAARRPRSAGDTLALLERGGSAASLAAGVGLLLRRLVRAGWQRVLIATGALLLLAGFVAWSLEPTRVTWSGREVKLETRAGLSLTRGPFARAVACAALDSTSFGLFRGTWVALGPPLEAGRGEAEEHLDSPGLLSLPLPWLPSRSGLHPETRLDYGVDTPYAIPTGSYHPRLLLPLGHTGSKSDLALAIAFANQRNYPARIDLVDRTGTRVADYHHPGWFERLYSFQPSSGGDPLVLAAGINNLVGPRQVVAALPCDQRAAGQGPPFAASLECGLPGGWYLFLSHGSQNLHLGIRFEGDLARIVGPGGLDLPIDARTGVPIKAHDRGGLSEEEWVGLRDGVLAALYAASGHGRVGDYQAAGDVLESYISGKAGPPELLSIPRYQAARFWMEAAADMGEEAYDRALENVTIALEHEPRPPRYLLLQAELFARLGRGEALRAQLEEFGRRPETGNYAYEWFLINRLAGNPIDPERFLLPFGLSSRSDPWPSVILEVIAHDRGAFDEAARVYEDATGLVYDLLRYWNVRALLSKPKPDPALVLERLDPEALKGSEVGYALPLVITRLRARTMLEAKSVAESEVEAALAELERFEAEAATDLHSLVMLPFAREDMAAVAKALGRDVLAREIRAGLVETP